MPSSPPAPVPPDTSPVPRVPVHCTEPPLPSPPAPVATNPEPKTPVSVPRVPLSSKLSPPPLKPTIDSRHPVHPRLQPRTNPTLLTSFRNCAFAQLLINEYSDSHASHIYNPDTGIKEIYDTLCAQDPEQRERSFTNKIGRLAQGVGTRMPKGNKNIFFIPKSQVPAGRKVTYANPVCDYHPLKDNPYCVRLTVSGDKLPYPSNAGAPATSLLEAKLLLNSVISRTPGAKFLSADLKDYFLKSTMDRYEYI